MAESAARGYREPGRPFRGAPFTLGLLAAGGALVAIAGFEALQRLGSVLMMIVAALFLAIGLNQPTQALVRRGLRRGTAVVLVVLASLVLLLIGILVVVPPVASQAAAFFENLPRYLNQVLNSAALSDLNGQTNMDSTLADAITPHTVATVAGGLVGGAVTVAGALVTILSTLLLTIFLLGGLERLRDGAYHLVVASRRERVRSLGDGIEEKVGAYLIGALTVALFAALTAFAFCQLAGVPYPFLMALVVGFFDLIPQIGAFIGSTVVVFVSLTQSLGLAIAATVFFCAYQGLENWLVYPRLMSRAVKVTNFAAIVSVLIGAALLGVFGVLLAVPTCAAVQLIVREVVFPRQDSR
jgi:predicted PurR-regulated permease PerM